MALRPARRPPAAAGRSKLSPRTPSLGLHYSQGQLPPVGRLVHPHPPLLEQEELLATVLGGVEDLTRLEVNVRKFAVEPFYLLFRQQLEDVHQGEDRILSSVGGVTISPFLSQMRPSQREAFPFTLFL